MIYQDQSCHDLELNIIKGSINTNEFEVLSTNSIISPLGKIVASIIGSSHYFQLYNNQNQLIFTEVLACEHFEQLSTEHNIYHYKNFNTIKNIDLRFDNIQYQTKIWQQKWDQEIINTYCQPSTAVTKEQKTKAFKLLFVFPNTNQEPSDSMTSLSASIISDSVHIKTLHSYPNDKKLVLTHTQVSPV